MHLEQDFLRIHTGLFEKHRLRTMTKQRHDASELPDRLHELPTHKTFRRPSGTRFARTGKNEEKRENGRGERIRTSGLYVPNVALYQAKLHPEMTAEKLKNPFYREGC